MILERSCGSCGASFAPRHARQRRCPRCEPSGRASRSPTTRAQDATYARNRALVLTGAPTCALRLRCAGAAATTADHILAVARGGTNELSNLQPACAACNASKGASAR